MKKRERKKKKRKIYILIFSLISLTFITILKLLNILPILYFTITLVLILLLYIISLVLIKKNKKIGYIISILLTIIYILIGYYLLITLNFLGSFTKDHYSEETYLVLTLKEYNYTDIKDIENQSIGYINNNLTNINKAIEKLNKKINITKEELNDYTTLFNKLDKKEIPSILLEESYYNIKKEEEDVENYQILYKITVRNIIKEKSKTVNITEDPFTIYISGIDVYGDISTVSRSDVNILITVNPKTKQILLTSIPRDYYVKLSGTTGYKDKLTHAGNYGVNMSISTIEELLNIDINYYLRVNFTTLEKLIDSLDGVDVYSEYSFISYIDNYKFYKGYNHMNGKQALAFSRERKSLPGGDNDRGKNQEAVIEAIIRKATSKEVIYKYTKILNSIKSSFQTNLSDNDITKLIQKELENPGGWNITSNSLTGTGSMDYTYSYSSQKLYVTIPDEESITNAKELIDKVNTGSILESTYNNNINNVKYPDKITITPTPSNENTKKDNTIKEEEKENNDNKENTPLENNTKNTDEEDNKEETKTEDTNIKNKEEETTENKDNTETENKEEEAKEANNE